MIQKSYLRLKNSRQQLSYILVIVNIPLNINIWYQEYMSQKPQQLPDDAKEAYKGKVYSVWEWEQELFDGTKTTFEAIARVDAAMIIGILPDNKILMVEDTQPHRPGVISMAGGRIEPGEQPEEGARREFREETGYEIGKLKEYFIDQASTSTLWKTYIYIGRDLKKVGEPALDPGEKIKLLEYSFEDFLKLGQNPKVRNRELRLKLLEAQIDPKKKEELYKLLFE